MSSLATVEGPQTLEVVPGGNLGTWQTQAIKRLFQVAELPADWDSYGSPSPSKQAVSMAIWVIHAITLDDLPVPNVVPVPGGGIQVEWQCGARELELELLPDGTLEFLKSQNGVPFEEGVVEWTSEPTSLAAWLVS